MALVIGHSQTKYLSEYLNEDNYSVFSYPGFKTYQFQKEDEIFDVAPFFSVVVLVVGANDIGSRTPAEIVCDIKTLCRQVRHVSPSATVLVSEVLPRTQNMFHGKQLPSGFIQQWNYTAWSVNRLLHSVAKAVSWIKVVEHPEFHTLFGVNKQLLSFDGLHLSYDGTDILKSNIDNAVRSTSTLPTCTSRQPVLPPRSPSAPTPAPTRRPPVPMTSRRQRQPTSTLPTRTCRLPVPMTTSRRQREPTLKLPTRTCRPPVPMTSRRQRQPTSTLPTSTLPTSTLPTRNCRPPVPASTSYLGSEPFRQLPSAPVTSTRYNRRRAKPFSCRQRTSAAETSTRAPPQTTTKSVSTVSSSRKRKSSVELIESDRKYYLSSDSVKLVGGGNETPLFSKTDRIITPYEAADIIQQNLPDSVTNEPPYRPSAGSVYVYDDSGDILKKEDWRADGYTWRNYGKRVYKSEGKVIEKSFFKINNKGVVGVNFQKHAFRFVDADYNGRTVIVYLGDSEEYKGLAHGNRKRNTRQHKRTKPSVLRNERQIKNIQAKMRRDMELSHDSLYGLHLLVEQLDGYILSIKTTPDLEVVVGSRDIFDEVNRLLMLKDINMEIYYDTTFNLGDFYVSTVVIQHPMFKEKPSLPVAFILHERKFQSCHENFIRILKSKLPKLQEKNICVTTDREQGIVNAFEEQVSNCQILICWNHIFNDVKFWVNKHGGGSDDKKVYDMHMRDLLKCENREAFDQMYNTLKQIWSEAFLTYFDEHLYSTIVNYSGRWILESKDIYNPYSGVTNNVIESLNAKLKRLLEYKERAIDEIVLYLFYLQGNDLAELIRAFCGESEWTPGNNFRFAARDPDTINLPQNVCHPDKIIQLIKADLATFVNDNNKIPAQPDEPDLSDESNEINTNKNVQPKSSTSQHSLMVKTIMDNDIVLVPQMGTFMVKGSKGNKYSVSLFPKEKCSCPATTRCYHILAAMMSICMPVPEEKKTFNLTQLRRNCTPKQMKKCGTKKGRKGDNDGETTINPAPDSVMKTFDTPTMFDTPSSTVDIEHMKSSGKVKKKLFDMSTPKSILKQKHTPSKTPKSSSKKRKLQFKPCDSIKIPKLETDLSDICEDSEFIELDLSRESSGLEADVIDEKQMWIKELGLTTEDKNDLYNDMKLNSNHMEAVNILLKKQVGNFMGGLQLTEKVPSFNDDKNRWIYKIPIKSTNSPWSIKL